MKDCGVTCLEMIIKYYGGYVAGIAAAFATVDKVDEYKVVSAFDPTTLPDYAAYAPGECPMCKAGGTPIHPGS